MLYKSHPPLRVLIADDHELIRFSLKSAFQRHPQIDLLGMAENGQEAVDMVLKYRPDVIVIDLQMPVMDGLSASNQIKLVAPHTQIVAYSSVQDPQVEVMVQTAKIDAFCDKDTPIQDLIDTVLRLGQQSANRS
ncbi:MAG TPA: response regulator transcription factor [Crinalium sp.]|jgi:DNA-binding NarL/FixJ family response regulator